MPVRSGVHGCWRLSKPETPVSTRRGGGELFPGGWGHTGQWPEEALGCDTGKGAAGRPVNLGP